MVSYTSLVTVSMLNTSLPGNHGQNYSVTPGLLCHPFAIWQPCEALKQLIAFSLSPYTWPPANSSWLDGTDLTMSQATNDEDL